MNNRTDGTIALAPVPPLAEGHSASCLPGFRLAVADGQESLMTAITNVALAPFALLFRISYANPILAILASAAAGGIALVTGHENWMAVLVSFAAYLLIWMDETELRASEAARVAPQAE